MQIISTFFICVMAGFFIYPLISRLAPSRGKDRDSSTRMMKESMEEMSRNVRMPFTVIKRKSFRVKK